MRLPGLTCSLFALATSPAGAQALDPTQPVDVHDSAAPEIVVTALGRPRDDLLGGLSVLGGDTLDTVKRQTIGDTLAALPGVSSTSFGPSASRPVLRGLQADRIRILTDGIGSFDASSSSADHAVAINPFTAERIEVLRGPAALLYGSAAIGGVVNVIDNRIPRKVPNEIVHLDAEGGYASAADEARGGGKIDVPLGETGVVLHADGSYVTSGDLRTGGFLLSRTLRERALASGDPAIAALAELRGRLPNTAATASEVGLGTAYIGSGGNIGIAVSRIDNRYGVPVRFSLIPGEEGEAPTLDVRQYRADLRAELTPVSGPFERIRLRAGYGDYRHFEIEDTGAIATTFLNTGLEGRLEFIQRTKGVWSGASGAQVLSRAFTVIGDEAFLPPTDTLQTGVFTVQNFNFGAIKVEAGGRIEHSNVKAMPSATLGTGAAERSFTTYSAAVGGSIAVIDKLRIGLNLTHSERSPTAEELFANGPHLATQAFEAGNPDFAKERSNGAEVSLRASGDGYELDIASYYNDFGRFIYQTPTGAVEDGLPVFAFVATGARQYGFEASGNARLLRLPHADIVADFVADYVRIKLDGAGNAPFVPPLRLLGGVEYQSEPIDLRFEVEHSFAQNRVAAAELPTAGFTLVNATASWKPLTGEPHLTLRLAANNILDVVARRHASFLKDYAPLAGRDIRVTASLTF